MTKKEDMPKAGDWVYLCVCPATLLPAKVKVRSIHSMESVDIVLSSLPEGLNDCRQKSLGYGTHFHYKSTVGRNQIALTKEEAIEKINKAVKKRRNSALKIVEECDVLMEQVNLLEKIECDRPESI